MQSPHQKGSRSTLFVVITRVPGSKKTLSSLGRRVSIENREID